MPLASANSARGATASSTGARTAAAQPRRAPMPLTLAVGAAPCRQRLGRRRGRNLGRCGCGSRRGGRGVARSRGGGCGLFGGRSGRRPWRRLLCGNRPPPPTCSTALATAHGRARPRHQARGQDHRLFRNNRAPVGSRHLQGQSAWGLRGRQREHRNELAARVGIGPPGFGPVNQHHNLRTASACPAITTEPSCVARTVSNFGGAAARGTRGRSAWR